MLTDRWEGRQRDSWQVCERYTVARAVNAGGGKVDVDSMQRSLE